MFTREHNVMLALPLVLLVEVWVLSYIVRDVEMHQVWWGFAYFLTSIVVIATTVGYTVYLSEYFKKKDGVQKR